MAEPISEMDLNKFSKGTLDDFLKLAEKYKITGCNLKLQDPKAHLLDYEHVPDGMGVTIFGADYIIRPRGWASKDRRHPHNLMELIKNADTKMLKSPVIRILSAMANQYGWHMSFDEDDDTPFSIRLDLGPRMAKPGQMHSTSIYYDPFDGSINIGGNLVDQNAWDFYRRLKELAKGARFEMLLD